MFLISSVQTLSNSIYCILQIAQGLQTAGLKQNEVVLIYSSNSIEYPVCRNFEPPAGSDSIFQADFTRYL